MKRFAPLAGCALASYALAGYALLALLGTLPAAGADQAAAKNAAKAASPVAAAAQIDALLRKEISATGQPAAKIGDELFLRRVTLDLAGQFPTPAEISAFALDPDPEKRLRQVERLLADSRYAENWARYWRDVIMYRRSEDRSLLAAEPLTQFLAAQLRENKPWSEIATAFITARGDVQENGATALIFAQEGKPEETTAEVARIFLGIQIQCAQCHDHPTDRWKREQFHELAAFFPRVAARPDMTDGKRSFIIAANDTPFAGGNFMGNRFRGSPEHYMPDLKNPGERGTQMKPVFFLTGQSLPLGTRDADRRGTLATWITDPANPYFAKALVNRLWAELCGEGFYEPVDDIGPDRECSAPQTLDYLAGQFAASGYDLRWLYATILATDHYQLASRTRRNPDQAPFQANVPQRLRADQVFTNLLSALGVADVSRGMPQGRYGFARGPRTLFAFVFGYDPSQRRDEIAGSIPQALALMNSTTVQSAISAYRPTELARLVRTIEDDQTLISEIYVRALARDPSPRELSANLAYFQKLNNRGEAAEDLLWALINSTEFLHRP